MTASRELTREHERRAHRGAPQAEADATAKILVNQSLSDATYLLVHCYPSNGCVVVHAAKFWRKSSGDNTLTATASFTRFGFLGAFWHLCNLCHSRGSMPVWAARALSRGSASAHIALGAQPGGLITTSLNRRRGKHRPNAAKCRRRQTHMARNGGNRIRKKRKGSGFYVSFHAPGLRRSLGLDPESRAAIGPQDLRVF